MNAALETSEPLAQLVRQMLTTDAPRKKAPKLQFHPVAEPEADFPPLPVASPRQESYLRCAIPASAVAVLSYLLLLAV